MMSNYDMPYGNHAVIVLAINSKHIQTKHQVKEDVQPATMSMKTVETADKQ